MVDKTGMNLPSAPVVADLGVLVVVELDPRGLALEVVYAGDRKVSRIMWRGRTVAMVRPGQG